MRILSIAWECPYGYGGLGTFVAKLLPEMTKKYEVTHYCLLGSSEARFMFYHGARIIRMRDVLIDRGGGVANLAAIALVADTLNVVGVYDAVLGHDLHSALVLMAAEAAGVDRRAVYIHLVTGLPLEFIAVTYAKTYTNSQLSARQIKEHYGVDATVVYPAPPIEPVNEPVIRKTEVPTILIPSRYQETKHPKHVLPALEKLREKGYKFRVVVFGRAAELYRKELPDWIEILSDVPEDSKKEVYRSANIVLQVGFPEPFGLVALEAIALGVPTLVSNMSGVAEVLPREAVYSKENLVEILEPLLADPRAREELWWKERKSNIMNRTWSDVWKEIEGFLI